MRTGKTILPLAAATILECNLGIDLESGGGNPDSTVGIASKSASPKSTS